MTGFFPTVRGYIGTSFPVFPPTTCNCIPQSDVFCVEGDRLRLLCDRGERIVNQFGERLPLNIAIGNLADHLGVDRASILAILRPHRGVRSQTRVP